MIIEGYDIQLIRLTEQDIELVRKWRNSQMINQFMEYREVISPKQQQKWFTSINTVFNNYFIIKVSGKKIGLIYGADIDWDSKETGNGGIFIWESSYWESIVPLSASLLLTDTSLLLDLRRTYIKVLKDNKKAIAFNKSLGYKLCKGQEAVSNQMYCLEMTDYISRQKKMQQRFFSPKMYSETILTFEKENTLDMFFHDIVDKVETPMKSNYKIIVK